MRTTVDIADDVLAAARTLAAEQSISLGAALSAIARRGLASPTSTGAAGLPTFAVGGDAAAITPEMVRAANEDA
jgi:hypothetical protein